MTTEIRTVALGVPQVFRQPLGRSFCGVPGGAGAGTILLEYSNDGVNYIAASQGASVASYSLCPDTFGIANGIQQGVQQQGYVRATAATAAGYCIAADYAQVRQGVGGPQQPAVANVTVPLVSGVADTSEHIVWSQRFPPGYLPANWQLSCNFQFSATNNSNVKTIKFYFGPTGSAGTALGSIAATSLLNGVFDVVAYGGNDFVTVKGGSVGAGATALVSTTLTTPWNQQEQEFCITITKATAADVMSIDRLRSSMFTQ